MANGFVSTGWGGRTADTIANLNGAATFPMTASVGGTNIFSIGMFRRPLALASAPSSLSRVIRLDGFPNPPATLPGIPRYDAMTSLHGIDDNFTMIRAVNEIHASAFETMEALRNAGDPVPTPFPLSPRTSLGNQLEQIAKLIKINHDDPGLLALKRQIFFCSIGGFDTHGDQVDGSDATAGQHANLWTTIDNAVKAFYDAMVNMGAANSVTLVTMSEFGRTFVPNGGLGTDHAWDNHVFVIGGAVNGGDFYGVPGTGPGQNGTVFPTLAAGGPDDTDNGGGARGRWIPTTGGRSGGRGPGEMDGRAERGLAGRISKHRKLRLSDLGFMS